MKIKQIKLFPLTLKLVKPFATNHGVTLKRPITLVEIQLTSGVKGYGEIQAFNDNSYAPQTQILAWQALQKVLPQLIKVSFQKPNDLAKYFNQLTSFARAALEMAIWDCYGKTIKQPLTKIIEATEPNQKTVAVGTVIGMQPTFQKTIDSLILANQQGYQKIKFKTEDRKTALTLVSLTHKYLPQTIITIDANQAWENDLTTFNTLQKLEQQGLTLIEEPLKKASLMDYAKLQSKFPHLLISLDESINDLNTIRKALQLNSANAFTIKQGKIGGISQAIAAINLVNQTPKIAWIGGMLTSGLGRSVDLILASYLKNSYIPADISASSHYFEQDIIHETLAIHKGHIKVPQNPGIGVSINWNAIQQLQFAPTIQYK